MTNSITVKLTSQQEQELYAAFREHAGTPVPYSKWQLHVENCVITCYTSGKTLFQGKEAATYAAPYLSQVLTDRKKSLSVSQNTTYPQAGSDEVGTGDYLGPVVVAAAYVDQEHVSLLQKLGVKDSKALNDAQILKIGAVILENIPHSVLIVPDSKYNEIHRTNNMNAIKAKLHNQAYVHLSKKVALPSLCVVDQFAEKPIYYHYLKQEPVVIRTLHFETKAENTYLAVGTASVLARYTFLKYWEKMEETYQMTFPKGAGPKVNRAAEQFIEKYGEENLGRIAKLHFKNTEEILKK